MTRFMVLLTFAAVGCSDEHLPQLRDASVDAGAAGAAGTSEDMALEVDRQEPTGNTVRDGVVIVVLSSTGGAPNSGGSTHLDNSMAGVFAAGFGQGTGGATPGGHEYAGTAGAMPAEMPTGGQSPDLHTGPAWFAGAPGTAGASGAAGADSLATGGAASLVTTETVTFDIDCMTHTFGGQTTSSLSDFGLTALGRCDVMSCTWLPDPTWTNDPPTNNLCTDDGSWPSDNWISPSDVGGCDSSTIWGHCCGPMGLLRFVLRLTNPQRGEDPPGGP